MKDRDARVPGPSLHGHEGENFARAADEKVRGNAQTLEVRKDRLVRIERPCKEALHGVT